MYKNRPVSLENIIQLFSVHPQCASQFPACSARPHSPSSSLISLFAHAVLPTLADCYWHTHIIPICSSWLYMITILGMYIAHVCKVVGGWAQLLSGLVYQV